MISESFNDEVVVQRRRFLHLSILRLTLACGYFVLQAADFAGGSTRWPGLAAGAVFAAFALFLILRRDYPQVRESTRVLLLIDTAALLLLALLSPVGEVGLPLLMFYFLVVEAALLHGPKEVLILTCVSLLFYGTWLGEGGSDGFRFSFGSFMFMVIVGGGLGYYFTQQNQRIEKRIADQLRLASRRSEPDIVQALESSLTELADWTGFSRAVLGLWDSSSDYFAACWVPHTQTQSGDLAPSFHRGQEWSAMAGRKLDFHAGDVSLTDSGGRKLERPFDLHPHVIQKFEIHNAVGCGLFDGDQAIGRILLVNRAGGVGNSQLQRLRTVAPFFLDVVRGLLLVRRAEHDAYEREHVRIAHDLHDGPLQSIISFEMRLRIIRKLKERDPVKADQEFDALCDISGKLVAEMRTFVHRTRAIEDDDSTLGASARRLVETFQKDSGVAVSMPGEPNGDWSVPRELGSEVLKIAREALHNVYKHAQATHVLFSLEKKQDQLELAVDDNGSGCPFGGRYSLEELDALQLGPKTIKRRVRALGGAMTLESTPGQGTSVRVSVPLS